MKSACVNGAKDPILAIGAVSGFWKAPGIC